MPPGAILPAAPCSGSWGSLDQAHSLAPQAAGAAPRTSGASADVCGARAESDARRGIDTRFFIPFTLTMQTKREKGRHSAPLKKKLNPL